jgi:hypothetical protein
MKDYCFLFFYQPSTRLYQQEIFKMHLTYTSATGATATLRPSAPFFLSKADGLDTVRQTVSTFGTPEQDGAFFISSTLDMRNITIEG